MSRVVLVHGFLGSPEDWSDVRAQLNPAINCECVSLRDLGCASIAGAADTLAIQLAKNPCDVLVGYSMGGRIALELASKQPELAPRLVLFSTSTGLHDADDRRARAEQDDARAVDLREHGMREFTRSWYELPMFAQFRAHASFARTRARRVIGDAEFWAGCVAGCSPGRTECRENDLARLASRTIMAVGDRDDYYVAFALRAASLAPTLTVEMIAGAGHVLPLEAPSACADMIERALKSST